VTRRLQLRAGRAALDHLEGLARAMGLQAAPVSAADSPV